MVSKQQLEEALARFNEVGATSVQPLPLRKKSLIVFGNECFFSQRLYASVCRSCNPLKVVAPRLRSLEAVLQHRRGPAPGCSSARSPGGEDPPSLQNFGGKKLTTGQVLQ